MPLGRGIGTFWLSPVAKDVTHALTRDNPDDKLTVLARFGLDSCGAPRVCVDETRHDKSAEQEREKPKHMRPPLTSRVTGRRRAQRGGYAPAQLAGGPV